MLSILALAAVVLSQCSAVQERKEWRELTETDRQNYLKAVKCLQTKQSRFPDPRKNPKFANPKFPTPKNRQEDFAYVHSSAIQTVRNTPQFLPWHRVFVATYDRELRECQYTGPMPYWDWSIDFQAPKTSSIWKHFYQTTEKGCILAPFLAQITYTFPTVDCVKRNLLDGVLYSQEQLAVFLASNSYDSFRVALERNPHNLFLAFIGGTIANQDVAPYDPLYFLHLRNIDRLWSRWQEKNALVTSTDNGFRAILNYQMQFFGLTKTWEVKHAISTKSGAAGGLMCYSYSHSITPNSRAPNSVPPLPSQKPNNPVTTPAIPSPLAITDYYLTQWAYSQQAIQDIRYRELQIAQFTATLNEVSFALLPYQKYLDGNANGWRSKTMMEQDLEDNLLIGHAKVFLSGNLNNKQ